VTFTLSLSMSSPKPLPHREDFEAHGETGTRYNFADREGEVGRAAKAWLAERAFEREASWAATRDAREEETLSIARAARSDARLANTIAIAAVIVAVIATIIAAYAAIKGIK
jgi:hypothetical protein